MPTGSSAREIGFGRADWRRVVADFDSGMVFVVAEWLEGMDSLATDAER